MILITSFYLIYFNLFRLWPTKTDFVLTTLATLKQSQIFPQHIGPETPLQHDCDFIFFEKNVVLNYFCWIVLSKKKTGFLKNVGNIVSMFSIKNQMQVKSLSRNPRDKKQKKKEETTAVFSIFP